MSENKKKWAQVVAKAWMDPKFKAKLMENPTSVLKEFGIQCDSSKKYKVYEAHKNEILMVIPEKPTGSLSENELRNIAAAASEPGSFGFADGYC